MLEIAITNRHICKADYFTQIEKVASHKPFAILLREKDLTFDKYFTLSKEINRICMAQAVPLISHTYAVPGVPRLHVPFALASEALAREHSLSVSVHSPEEALRAEAMGAEFVIAGHIFATGSKPGMPPRGLAFLREVCEAVDIPVFAIGGITMQNAQQCLDAGAAGICRMSYWMGV
ncbi:MAG: thiamine phosphate synthase [Oscillospiraceae bacterium]|nr:thiamine phosphate synthase [Oscillospiraceae bacterium]